MSNFNEKETVLCYHGPMLYEAKILETRKNSDGHVEYLVHYRGWKDRWDEVVREDSLIKLDEDGLALQEELKAKYFNVSPGPNDAGEPDNDQDKTAALDQFKVGRYFIPKELTDILGKDWNIINRHRYLYILPAKVTIHSLIEEFGKVYRKKKIVGLGVFDQFSSGIIKAIDSSTGRNLLYRFERPQLLRVIQECPDRPLSEIYPPTVLLRYLLKLPHQLDDLNLAKTSQLYTTTKKLVDALIKFIVDFRKDFFPSNLYLPASQDYINEFTSMYE